MIDENTLYINLKFFYQHCTTIFLLILKHEKNTLKLKLFFKNHPKQYIYIYINLLESIPKTNSYRSNTKISRANGYKSFNLAAFRFLPDCRSTLLRQLHPYPPMIEPALNDPPRGSERDGQI